MDANRTNPQYELKSELARVCLPGAKRDPDRRLAWVNSICILFLAVGLVGTQPAVIATNPPPPIAEPVPVITEPITQPPPKETQATLEPTEENNQTEAPQVVVVTPETPAVVFSVPTVGNVMAPSAIAQAPPLNPMKAVTPVKDLPQVLENTGKGGERPEPKYPEIAKSQLMQGTVVLAMTVDDKGAITEIHVKESSGYPLLDRSALDHVKRHWIIPPGGGTRQFEVPIRYKLSVN
jgi:protein TonB